MSIDLSHKTVHTTAGELPEEFKGELKTPFGTVPVDGVEHGIGYGNLTGIKSDNFEDGMEYLSSTCPVSY